MNPIHTSDDFILCNLQMYFYDKETNKQTNTIYMIFFKWKIFNKILAKKENIALHCTAKAPSGFMDLWSICDSPACHPFVPCS